MMTTKQDIITLAIDAYEFAERESKDQAKAEDQRNRENYYDKVQALVHYTLGIEAHIEISWQKSDNLSTFMIAELGPFTYHDGESSVGQGSPYITGEIDPTRAVEGAGWVKIESLADLGYYLRLCGYGRAL